MALDVFISERAEKNLHAILSYLSKNVSEENKLAFLAQLSEKINQIAVMPYMYRASLRKEGLREGVINKHIMLYYRVTPTAIEIITIQDARRDPDTLAL